MMFVHHCSSCDRDQLVFPSMFTGATRAEGGMADAFTCWCGAAQTRLEQPTTTREGHELVA